MPAARLALLAALPRPGAGAALLRGAAPLGPACGRFEAAWRQSRRGACDGSGGQGDICQESPAFCQGNLGLERCELPQTPYGEEHFQLWVAAAAEKGVGIKEEKMTVGRVARLLPSQNTLDACKVCAVAFAADACLGGGGVPSKQECEAKGSECFCVWNSGISITQGDHILDGHHRWAAVKILVESGRLPEATPALVEVYNASVEEVSKVANECGDLVGHSECERRRAP